MSTRTGVPSYYVLKVKGVTVEPFDVIRNLGLDYHTGSALAYIWRHLRKGGADDLRKAARHLIRHLAECGHVGAVSDIACYAIEMENLDEPEPGKSEVLPPREAEAPKPSAKPGDLHVRVYVTGGDAEQRQRCKDTMDSLILQSLGGIGLKSGLTVDVGPNGDPDRTAYLLRLGGLLDELAGHRGDVKVSRVNDAWSVHWTRNRSMDAGVGGFKSNGPADCLERACVGMERWEHTQDAAELEEA